MDIKNFVLSYYKNSTDTFHIHKVSDSKEAQKPHTHEYFQIYFISKGSLKHFVKDESSSLFHGDMFIIPPKTLHHIEPASETVFYSFSFMSDFLGEKTKINHLANNFLYSLLAEETKRIHPKISINSEKIFYVENIMEHLLKEFEEKSIGYEETAWAYCIILLNILARNYFENEMSRIPHKLESNKHFIMHCIEYIENNFADNLSLEEISKRSAMSKSNFCSLFLQFTGHSFNSYLNLCRIKKSTEYIKQGYKITSIYGLCGYNDFSTFYRNFKKIMGISPNEYKKIAKK
ncbi:MAG: helix-turn-helix domain-containing protein [Clostridia bacterium]|nr:helix-turn-helix domain-containing protein [Clostridia bacterium]